MKKKCNFRRLLFVLLLADIICAGFFGWKITEQAIPDTVYLSKKEEKGISELRNLPFVTYEDTIQTSKGNAYWISCKLFDTIPVKKIKVQTVEEDKVSVCGQPVGLYMETKGVLIIDTGEIVQADGMTCTPAKNIAKSGDYILKVNGETIQTKKELIDKIQNSEGKEVTLLVERDEEEMPICIQPVKAQDLKYKLGIWVKDDVQGIGTLTYATRQGAFGALGHGITDTDTGKLLTVSGGMLYDTSILKIVRGQRGTPGELSGMITYSDSHAEGVIRENTSRGIFGQAEGRLLRMLGTETVEVAFKQEVRTGRAVLRSSVSGELKDYEIQIQELRMNESDVNKGMIFYVTDPDLLALTGGVIQGMSGSPILQNGRLIGAVTHVFVNDPAKGYGIFAENMIEH